MSTTPSDALLELLAPDGYYTYLGIPKTPIIIANNSNTTASGENSSKTSQIDADLIKKNYRKLSLKHHPDKPGGDSETFRLLNRAQKVLVNDKLRQQYDVLGIDLDDDETLIVDQERQSSDEKGGGGSGGSGDDDDDNRPSTAQGIVHEIASMIVTCIIQLGVRTLMLGAVSVIIVRFWWTLYPALAFLAYIGYKIFQSTRIPGGNSVYDVLSPTLLAAGLLLMHHGRKLITTTGGDTIRASWSLQFWVGEAIVICMFTYNTVPIPTRNIYYVSALILFSALFALWFRGKFWNYVIVIAFIALVGLFTALAFPVMELLLEAILNEKLKLVGEKVRHHHQLLKQYYDKKLLDRKK